MANTRFSPGLNGPLHLGHIFTLLVNEYIAHSTNGKFYIRFDDTSYSSTKSGRTGNILAYQTDDIKWLDIEIDGWERQSERLDDVKEILKIHGFECLNEDEARGYKLANYLRLGTTFVIYPYAARQTPERVVMDRQLEITHLIRGEDFLTEVSYYSYVCQRLMYPCPEFWFLPRLRCENGDISKTNGGYTLTEFRANGYTPKDIKDILANSCLINPANGWNFYNIKQNPILTI